jgi:hypothetical protein
VKKKSAKAKVAKVNWAAAVRKFKPQLNKLSGVERRRLQAEALRIIYTAAVPIR